jgi:alpha-beta hydrolase superfamily lysophospholipase
VFGIAVALLVLYLLVCAAAFALQTKMLFPAPPATDESLLPGDAQRLALTATDGVKLVGIHLPSRANHGEAPLLLAFGGNGWNADVAALTLRDVCPQAEIVAFHYRGYPPSRGRPSVAALAADSLLVHDFAVRRFPGRRVVAVGFSIGTGLAVHVGAHRPVAGLILVTPYDDLTKVAAAQMPWLPVRLLFRNGFDAAAEMRGVQAPVAILGAGGDRIIPAERTDSLRRATPRLAFDRTIPRVGHNDIYRQPQFAPAMREALAALLAGR